MGTCIWGPLSNPSLGDLQPVLWAERSRRRILSRGVAPSGWHFGTGMLLAQGGALRLQLGLRNRRPIGASLPPRLCGRLAPLLWFSPDSRRPWFSASPWRSARCSVRAGARLRVLLGGRPCPPAGVCAQGLPTELLRPGPRCRLCPLPSPLPRHGPPAISITLCCQNK